MRIYSNTFDLATPVERRVFVSPNSIYAFGIKIVKNDVPVEDGTLKVYINGTEITPMEASVAGFTLFQRTSASSPSQSKAVVEYTKNGLKQYFDLTIVTTDSTVFDIDQEGGAFELPIASSTILGGIKVGQNLTIDADGKLNAVAGEETDPQFNSWLSSHAVVAGLDSQTINSETGRYDKTINNIAIGNEAIANGSTYMGGGIAIGTQSKIEADPSYSLAGNQIAIGEMSKSNAIGSIAIGGSSRASGTDSIAIGDAAVATGINSVQLGLGTNTEDNSLQFNTYKIINGSDGKIPAERLSRATTTTAGTVIVGSGLSVDNTGKISVTGGGSEETDPVFNNWLSGTNTVKIGKYTKYDTLNPNLNTAIILGLSATVGNGSTNSNGIAIGKNASVPRRNGIAIGENAQADAGEDAIAIGKGTIANALNYPLAIGSVAKSTADNAIAIGTGSISQSTGSIAIGHDTIASGVNSIVIGYATENRVGRPGEFAMASAKNAIQIGTGINNEISSFQVYSYKMLDATGKIPSERLLPATTTTAGAVIVGSGLSVDTDGKISVTGGGGGSETDPVFTAWSEGEEIAAGYGSSVEGADGVAYGKNAEAVGDGSTAIGNNARAEGLGSVQLGQGVNTDDGSLQFGDFTVIDEDGYLPAARLGGISTITLSGTYDDDSTFSFEVYSK